MRTTKHFIFIKHFIVMLLCALLSAPATPAQNPQRNSQTDQAVSQDVLIIIQQQQVRFMAQKAVEQMQLQVFNQSGELTFDSGLVTANEINWPFKNIYGETLKSGLYGYALSIREPGEEKSRVKRGHFIVDRAADRDGAADKLWITSQNAEGIGTELTVARDENGAVAGTTTSSERALEQRGESEKRGAGERGVEPEAQNQTAASQASAAAITAGTVGRIAKFTSATELGNSVMTEANGNVGININPTAPLHLGVGSGREVTFGTPNGEVGMSLRVASGARTDLRYNGSLLQLVNGLGGPPPATNGIAIDTAGKVGIGTTSLSTSRMTIEGQDALTVRGYEPVVTFLDSHFGNARGVIQQVNGGFNLFTDSYLRGANMYSYLRLDNSGNVGIGTANPTSKLEILGQDGLAITGYQPFLTLRDTNTGGLRSIMAGGNGDFGFYPDSFIGAYPAVLIENGTGNVGIGTPNPQAKLDVAGRTRTGSLEITGGADFAENFDVNVETTGGEELMAKVEAGLVVSIDPTSPGKLQLSAQAYDRRVAGIISGAGGVKPGMMMSQAGTLADGQHPVALSGRVYCWVDASQGAIEPGDPLTTSATPGHAMKAADAAKAQGAIIGKAMTGLKEGKGLVLVLVTLQ